MSDNWGQIIDSVQVQEPVLPNADLPKPLPPFVFPEAGNDPKKPRVLAITPMVRGKRNPVLCYSVGGQDFYQYRLPDSATLADTNKALLRPNLPVVNLTDRQVEALRDRAKVLVVAATFKPPETDTEALAGYHEIKASEFIVIADYESGGDLFALARKAHAAAELMANPADKREAPGADEVEKAENALRLSNGDPQRGEHKAAAERSARAKAH